MKIKFALCAQTASVDRASNRVSVFNVYDHFPVSSVPINIPSITFVAAIESAEDEDTTNFRGIVDVEVNKSKVFEIEVPITFADHRLARVVLTFQGIPVLKPGPVTFRLSLPDKTCAEATFQVINVASKESIQLSTPAPTPATQS